MSKVLVQEDSFGGAGATEEDVLRRLGGIPFFATHSTDTVFWRRKLFFPIAALKERQKRIYRPKYIEVFYAEISGPKPLV